MKIMHLIAASAIMFGAASAARAADIINEEPTPEYMPPVFSWTGGYLGAQAGYGWAKTKFDVAGEDYESSVKSKGFIGGLFAGYNWDTGDGFVVGAEADGNYARVKKSFDSEYIENGVSYAAGGDVEMKWEGAVRARVGYAYDRFLPYIAGGVAFGKVEYSFYDEDPSSPSVAEGSFKKTQVGWTAGAGVDYAATDNIFVRLEYRYTDLGDKSYHFLGDDFKPDFKMHEVRVGVAYKF